jgi:hypothetical protein
LELVTLRDSGLTFREIGKRLGITKSSACRFYRERSIRPAIS